MGGRGDGEFPPEEYAAGSRAPSDGHAGAISGGTGTFGVTIGDPSTCYVMGGIAGHVLEWVRGTDEWDAAN